MRLGANFTLHAVLAAFLVAFAAASAAAGGPATIKLTEDPAAVTKNYLARNDGRVQQLEIQGWQWESVSKVDSFTVKQGVTPVTSGTTTPSTSATGENVQGSQDIVITGSRIPQPNLSSASPVKGGLDAGMKQLEARDRMGNSAATAAPDRGTLRIKVKMPWLACEEGREYPSFELNDGNQRIVLRDAAIASCGTTAAKVKVRGWDPEKKEQ